MWTAAFAPSTGEKTGDFPPVFIQFWVPPSGHKKTPQVCVTYGVAPADGRSVFSYVVMGQRPPIAGCCTHISAFLGLSACQGSLNSSKIVVNEMVLTCLKCPWIQCFQGIIRFWLDFYTNKNKLSYIFRLVYSESIPDYIQKMRLEKAQKQLEHPGISIYEIAHSIGFKNQGSFSDWFRKETGFSPSEYRNKTNGWD